MIGNVFLIGQSWRVLKSWYTGGGPEGRFRRCFVDGLKFRRGTCVYRVPKCDVTENEICEIMGFVKLF